MTNTGDNGFLPPAYPAGVAAVLDGLSGAGFPAYIVGGSLRDALLGRPAHDFDVASPALPGQVTEVFAHLRTVPTGARHGTVTVICGGCPVEVTTFRTDGDYSDGRHPDSVCFTRRLEDDLARRDFTVNAMAYSPGTGLIDPFGGREDLARRTIRCVGDPGARFTEDALRIMRAYRFAAKLNFEIEPRTAAAAVMLRGRLRMVSAERIASELAGILSAPAPSGVLRRMLEGGIFDVILPSAELVPDDCDAVDLLEPEPALRFGGLLRGRECGRVREILRSLKYPNALIREAALIASAPLPETAEPYRIRLFAASYGDCAEKILAAAAARGDSVTDAAARLARIRADGDPLTLRELAVDGSALTGAGLTRGCATGEVLAALHDAVLRDPSLNRSDTLLRLAAELAEKFTDNKQIHG